MCARSLGELLLGFSSEDRLAGLIVAFVIGTLCLFVALLLIQLFTEEHNVSIAPSTAASLTGLEVTTSILFRLLLPCNLPLHVL